MNRLVTLFGLLLLLPMMAGCSFFDVIDDLYDIDAEQGKLALQVSYSEHSADVAASLPSSYRLSLTGTTALKNSTFSFVSLIDGARYTNKMDRTTDILSFADYVQPGSYRFITYNDNAGYEVSSSTIKVEADGASIARNPDPFFMGYWKQDIAKGENVSAEVVVRQRTRRLLFKVLLDMSDTISYLSSTATLSNVCYQIDLNTGNLDAGKQMTLPLQMTQGTYTEGGKTYQLLQDEINVLSPSAEEYSASALSNNLTIVVRYATPSEVKQETFTFDHVLDNAYSTDYAVSNNDPYCICHYTWQTTLYINI